MLENRPWGTYEILHEDAKCKIKKIIVNPNQRLSYQYHKNRDENLFNIKHINKQL